MTVANCDPKIPLTVKIKINHWKKNGKESKPFIQGHQDFKGEIR